MWRVIHSGARRKKVRKVLLQSQVLLTLLARLGMRPQAANDTLVRRAVDDPRESFPCPVMFILHVSNDGSHGLALGVIAVGSASCGNNSRSRRRPANMRVFTVLTGHSISRAMYSQECPRK